jgi:class I fructose-bisphosphate aldolase/fructose-bisphosphate aldolase/2-amino-3,7-dideoxy-D-threo-hept-6-ulosonate synthase
MGPIDGLDSIARIESWIRHSAITGLIAHKGMVERLGARGLLHGRGVMIHVNGMISLAPTADRKELLTTVERAVRLGADAISLQLNFDGSNDAHNLQLLGSVVDEADRFGLPVLTMLYDKVPGTSDEHYLKRLRHLMRACIELGTDALKLATPADLGLIPALLEGVQDATQVFFAGGERCSEAGLLALARAVVLHGASGLCVGRNVFQSENAAALLGRLQQILFDGNAAALPGPSHRGESGAPLFGAAPRQHVLTSE